MNKKRTLSFMLAAGLIATQTPAITKAAELSSAATKETVSIDLTKSTTTEDSSASSAKQLEKVLKSVKSKVKVPDSYSVFEYYYQDGSAYSKPAWVLRWYTKDNKNSISITCDNSANILYYSKEVETKKKEVPKHTSSELKGKADSFIKTIAPSIKDSITFKDTSFSGMYSGYYVYSYERVENGIPMPENTLSVGVDAVSGEVVYFNADWLYDVSIPSDTTSLSKKEAAAKVGKNIKMQLMYLDRFDTGKDGKTSVSAYLVYAPDQSYLAVDAQNGKVYTTKNEWITTNRESKAMDTAYSAGAKMEESETVLTEEEMKKIEELNQLLSKEKAIKIISDNKELLLDSNAKSISATLNQMNYDSSNHDAKRYVWNIRFTDPREEDYKTGDIYRPYTYAIVDAKTGELLSFQASVQDYYMYANSGKEITKTTKYTKEQCQKIFEAFAKKQNEARFQQVTLATVNNTYTLNVIEDKEITGGYDFTYNRVNEGVEFSSNNINGAVDGVTGKISSYGYHWYDNVKFESPKNTISAEAAFDKYISFEGFDLVYEINTINKFDTTALSNESYSNYNDAYSMKEEVRLVYRTDINPVYVSPFTGKQLTYDGEVYTKESNDYKYSDISGHPLERSIQILSDMGAGFKGTNFYPDKSITQGEFQDLFNKVSYSRNDYKLEGSIALTREKAAYFAIQSLDLDYVAKLSGIFKLDTVDADSVSQYYFNYVALAKGLGILSVDSNNKINPSVNLTRAEAADLILKLLGVNY